MYAWAPLCAWHIIPSLNIRVTGDHDMANHYATVTLKTWGGGTRTLAHSPPTPMTRTTERDAFSTCRWRGRSPSAVFPPEWFCHRRHRNQDTAPLPCCSREDRNISFALLITPPLLDIDRPIADKKIAGDSPGKCAPPARHTTSLTAP